MQENLVQEILHVNVVAPGFINTDMTRVLPDKVKEEIIKSIPLKRIGNPKDVANVVFFLHQMYQTILQVKL